ncbi:putative membrane protein [Paucimonas lemoignei]|uniref:Putative membrane protein n=1 Tax=Paucimonas lemoignei TaxID=29443 RepID=A0A4R3HP54_PAULE|nr:DUF2244 domain-containing protein [Paucimonas lemoignei]TCS32729.1 putative membrane protein [Paucimonas lemoignei]
MNNREWLLKRNCSLTPRQSIAALGSLCLAMLGLAVPFVLLYGAWLVLVFAAMEIAALAAAFVHFARHARDRERIVLADGSLLVERVEADNVHQFRLEPNWIRVEAPRRYGDLIRLRCGGRYAVEVGRFVTVEKRKHLAEELRQALRK